MSTMITNRFSEKENFVMRQLNAISTKKDELMTCQKWLRDSVAKRIVFYELYSELFLNSGLKVLDIGGGLTAFTKFFAEKHDYTLIDIMAHEEQNVITADDLLNEEICTKDWFEYSINDETRYDVIIANDLFPNVDQRLAVFLKKFLPNTKKILLSLTYFEVTKFYATQRLDCEEILYMSAWDGGMLEYTLSKFNNYVSELAYDIFNDKVFLNQYGEPYTNSRKIALAKFKT